MFQEKISGTDVPTMVVPTVAVASDQAPPKQTPELATVRHLVFGPLAALRETTHTLYLRGYAEVNDWSQPQPSGSPGEYVTVLIKKLRLPRMIRTPDQRP